MLQPLVLLDKKKNVILSAIYNTDIGLCVPEFATNKEREDCPCACDAVSTNITRNLQKLDGKITHCGFTYFRDHGKIKQVDQLCEAILLHVVSIGYV